MQYLKGLEGYTDTAGSAVTFGKFDGLHRGHSKLISKVRELGEQHELNSIVCSFDMNGQGLLMTKEERQEHLEGKVDYLIDCPFSENLRRMSAEGFIKNIIKGLFHAEYVIVGTDFHFGYGQSGDAQILKDFEEEYGYKAIIVEKERYEGRIISSTYVKEMMREGNVELADDLLGYKFGITGVVEHGKQLGRKLGFPTFNVSWPEKKLVPPRGVYLSRVFVDNAWYNGISNVGVKPTVSHEGRVLIETYLFGYSGNAYDKKVKIELLKFRRPEQKFHGVEEMKENIDRDIEYGKCFFAMDKGE